MSVGKIWQMSAVEIASIFIAAFGIAALYAIIYCIFVPKEKVAVDEGKGIFVFGKKKASRGFGDIIGVDFRRGPVHKLLRTEKLIVFFEGGERVRFYFSLSDAEEFCAYFPVRRNSEAEENERIASGKEKYVSLLSDFVNCTFLAILVIATVFPAVHAYLASFEKSRWFLYAFIVAYAVCLVIFILMRTICFLRYTKYEVALGKQELRVRYGKGFECGSQILYKNVLGIELKQGLMEKLFALYRLKIYTAENANGASDAEMFPFLLKKEEASKIVSRLQPSFQWDKRAEGGGFHRFAPYLQYLAIPAIIVFCMSFFINFFLLLLELDILLFAVCLYFRKGYSAEEAFLDFRCGVFSERRVVLPYYAIQTVIGKSNPIAAAKKITALEISIGRYTPVFFPGYILRTDFNKLVEKVDK